MGCTPIGMVIEIKRNRQWMNPNVALWDALNRTCITSIIHQLDNIIYAGLDLGNNMIYNYDRNETFLGSNLSTLCGYVHFSTKTNRQNGSYVISRYATASTLFKITNSFVKYHV
jgi:hypothetical protein